MKNQHHFGFPYEPYQVQLNLMEKIYDLLKTETKVGLFESPTGTVISCFKIVYRAKQ